MEDRAESAEERGPSSYSRVVDADGSAWRDDRIGSAIRGENPTVLMELEAGFAVMGDVQFLPGYCVLLGKDPSATALAQLSRIERVRFLADADLLATAVERVCRALDPGFSRINLEVLGNTDAFVHAHVWPRYGWEAAANRGRPVWLYQAEHWHDRDTALGCQHVEMEGRLRQELNDLIAADTVRLEPGP